jgi:CreA protein
MASPLNFNGRLTISMQVKDRKRSTKWYGDVLGFELEYDVPEIGWCELRTECANVNLGFSEVEKPRSGAGPVPVFEVKDIDAARARMEKMDVRFDGDTRVIPGMVKLATFFDPDGHAWMLSQTLASH